MDIFVAASRRDSESFGVAVLEASATGLPVVVSDVGGLPEVVQDKITGLIVPSENPLALARALYSLICDKKLRRNLGQAGIKRVEKKYRWQKSVEQMSNIYMEILADRT
jgi:glycosyltransferase involved in cell wall biosynthesis